VYMILDYELHSSHHWNSESLVENASKGAPKCQINNQTNTRRSKRATRCARETKAPDAAAPPWTDERRSWRGLTSTGDGVLEEKHSTEKILEYKYLLLPSYCVIAVVALLTSLPR
jgi:hypothetical protein